MEFQKFALKILAIITAVVVIGFGAEVLYDFSRAVHPQTGKPLTLADLDVTPAMVRAVASPFARAYNNTLALILTFIGLAIPITANMYTPKLIELFVRDRVNLAVLGLYAVLTAHSILAATLSFDAYAGKIPFWVSFFGAIVGWTILLPYYFYVLTFLNPVTIIRRVEQQLLDEMGRIAASGESGAAAQERLAAKIQHMGSVLLRAVDRGDRDVALDAIRSHIAVVKRFHQIKGRMNPKFFEASDEITIGMSRAATTIMSRAQIWVEQKIMNQILLAFNAALGKMPDGVSMVADSVKDLADHSARVGQPEVLELLIRVMNTFLREAIKKKDVFSIYNVLYNYKSLMRKLMDDAPGKVPDLARHLRYYADFAKAQGMPFIYELASYELADVAEYAYDHKIAQAKNITDAILGFEGVATSVRLVKSRAILGAYFLQHGMQDEVARVTQSLAGVPASILDTAKKELMSTQDRVFWEVTDRGTNFDFIEEDRKAKVAELFAHMQGSGASATGAALTASGAKS